MVMDWKMVTREHVVRTCEIVGKRTSNMRKHGLFVLLGGRQPPAKEVAHVGYLIATGQPLESPSTLRAGSLC